MKKSMRYILERVYPYSIAGLLVTVMYFNKINYISSENIDNAIDGVMTITSLIIGFLGAVLPVIMGMKNSSKFVQYVFEKDTEHLFMKYTKYTLFYGIVLIAVSVTLYFRKNYETTFFYKYVFYVWIFMVTLFLSTTYRCISNMFNLIFCKDVEVFEQLIEMPVTEHEKRLRDKLLYQQNINNK